MPPRPPISGRGTEKNPANRFERIHVEPVVGEETGDDASPEPTLFYRDSSRSLLAENESPDVGFRFSINPYRGCEHGCVYCLAGDTPILMADGGTKRLDAIRPGDAIYGTARRGWYRRYVRTTVLDHWSVRKAAYAVTLDDGTRLVASADHRFLTEHGWKFVAGETQGSRRRPHLTTNNKLMGTGSFHSAAAMGSEYKTGYLCGLVRGDGHLGRYAYQRAGRRDGDQHQFRLTLVDGEALERARQNLMEFGVSTHTFRFHNGGPNRKGMDGIRTHARSEVERIERIIAWPGSPSGEWCSGFLAGIFDAEGSFSQGVLRISNKDPGLVDRVVAALGALSFASVVETQRSVRYVRIRGGLGEHLRFFQQTSPAIARKRDITGSALKSIARLRVASIERLVEEIPLYDITTGTGDFIANGVVSHNCYARPSHEYLGFSAGLDFERRILVKENAPELLRKAFLGRKWKPQTVALSGNTDCYQPVERRLGITRSCLEVFAEFRNPVGVVTKSFLVTRDADLLGELARVNAAHVLVSITSLDPELARRMEPRAATPERRLEAVRLLSAAGIPVGVMVAPVIPGLNDSEIPAILNAAAASGARSASWILLRLPAPVDRLFADWLARNFPARAERVLHRIRECRSGRMSDSRFGRRMRGEGPYAEQIDALFRIAARRAGLDEPLPPLDASAFRRPPQPGEQLSLYDRRVR
jgi:DNA repair photolyase